MPITFSNAVQWATLVSCLCNGIAFAASAETKPHAVPVTPFERLATAYPGQLDRVENGELIWKDGTRMPFDDGKQKSFDAWLDVPDIEDMFRIPYPTGTEGLPPARDSDPGRARHAQFFNKIYGDCLKAEVERNLVDVVWLPKKAGQKLKFSSVNGAAEKLAAVSLELDKLPARYNSFLFPSAGTYNCRVIAGTDRTSAHGHGIAIDLALPRAHYWRWTKTDPLGNLKYQNAFPMKIVSIFEAHGFIWGGKWYHYDTMHFEYRPELLPAKSSSSPDQSIGQSRTKRRNR